MHTPEYLKTEKISHSEISFYIFFFLFILSDGKRPFNVRCVSHA